MQLRPHQEPLVVELLARLNTSGRALAAHFTGAGKTAESIYIMQTRGGRWLVLTHGLQEIRANYMAQIERLAPHLRVVMLQPGWHKFSGMIKAVQDADIIVALPHSVYKHLDKLGKVTGMVVDEAHQFFFHDDSEEMTRKTMSRKINAWAASNNTEVLALTASHFRIRWDADKSFFSGEEGLGVNVCDDVTVQAIAVNSGIELDSYTKSDDLKESFKLGGSVQERAKLVAESIKHTPAIVVALNVDDADAMTQELIEYGFNTCVSHYNEDTTAQNLQKFKDGVYNVCVVVNRAQIGFDFDGLVTLVDASFTHNIERMQQAVGRLMRQHKDPEMAKSKRYIKLCPVEILPLSQVYVSTILALQDRENFRTYDGSTRSVRVKSPKPPGPPREPGEPRPPGAPREPTSALEEKFADYIQFLRDNWDNGEAVVTLDQAIIEAKQALGITVYASMSKKAELLKLITETGKAPPTKHPLRAAWNGYIFRPSTTFDPEFYEKVKHVIRNTKGANHEGKKAELLKLIKETGKAPPMKHPLRAAWASYTSPSSGSFDPEFYEKVKHVIRVRNPKGKKEELLKLITETGKAPHSKHPLYAVLVCYTSPSSGSFDPEFYEMVKHAIRSPKKNKEK